VVGWDGESDGSTAGSSAGEGCELTACDPAASSICLFFPSSLTVFLIPFEWWISGGVNDACVPA
jgi:hypothetical protein